MKETTPSCDDEIWGPTFESLIVRVVTHIENSNKEGIDDCLSWGITWDGGGANIRKRYILQLIRPPFDFLPGWCCTYVVRQWSQQSKAPKLKCLGRSSPPLNWEFVMSRSKSSKMSHGRLKCLTTLVPGCQLLLPDCWENRGNGNAK